MSIKFSVLFIFSTFFCYCQDIKITGQIVDQSNKPIAYANVIIINAINESDVKGTLTNDKGYFEIKKLQSGSYNLDISFIGYSHYKTTIELKSSTHLQTITLGEFNETLDAVNIFAKRPTYKKQSDRIIFNIEETSLTEGSVMDVLKSTPGILIINDEISVRNSANIIYLINNKRVYLTGEDLQQLLAGTTATNVQSVEVITNPPAIYDAEGSAVINITMSKNLIVGYNGSVYGNYTQGIYPGINVGTNHFYKTDKISVFANYSYEERKKNRINTSEINFIENNTVVGQWTDKIDRNTSSKSHQLNTNLDYTINDANVISFFGNLNLTPYWNRKANMTTQAIDSSFISKNNIDDTKTNVALNLDYINTSEDGNTFSVNMHHTHYDYDRQQDMNSKYYDINNVFTRDNIFNSNSVQNTYIYSGQADYSTFLNKDIALSFGAKVSLIDSKSSIDQFYLEGDRFVIDEINSGTFDYNEMNYATYVNLSKSWDTWSLSAGLRGEFTDAEGKLSSLYTLNSFNYLELFPTFNVSHDFNEDNSLGLSYGKRIERPSYASLNPFKYYFNDYTFLQGNPNLEPTISHLTTLSYTFKSIYTFELYYRFEDKPTSELVFQDNETNQIFYLPTNLDKSVDFGFDFLMYQQFTHVWSVYVVNSIFHNKTYFEAIESGNSIETNDMWSMYTNIMNFFSFTEDRSLSGEISVLYMSPMINGSSDISSRAQIDLGLKKSFNNGKWVASLKLNDIFKTSNFTVKNKYLNQDNTYNNKYDNQYFRFGLRYNFGNTKLSTNEKEEKEINERNRLSSESTNN
ncbi:outer membrane beta-barrel protein [Formosa sediminum]|uniref:Outer membrane beta-barrel protein n=1 Tax=Formosa sediminum TaxID=2594004 RepID=A0A516GNR4_9FLAO|nr:TonB-dependent receptor [Formosa sediminum]QDO93171.1 outer membrane beta-barrel protein [Formosa sediminum]